MLAKTEAPTDWVEIVSTLGIPGALCAFFCFVIYKMLPGIQETLRSHNALMDEFRATLPVFTNELEQIRQELSSLKEVMNKHMSYVDGLAQTGRVTVRALQPPDSDP